MNLELISFKIIFTLALAGVAQWIECWPEKQGVAGLIPGWGTSLGCGPGGNQSMSLSHIDVSLPLFLPPFHSL